MIKLNNYITEAWSGVKKHTISQPIIDWCDEMGIKNYTINSQGEIDVNGDVHLIRKNIKELPYKFGTINGYFSLTGCKNLVSLKNCPDCVDRWFACDDCKKLESLEGCPKNVETNFFCEKCKHEFTKEEVKSLCKVGFNIYN